MRRTCLHILMPMLLAGIQLPGCGTAYVADYPNALTSADGRVIVLGDVQAIVDDGSLSESEKREALRGLGIEDEQIIDALLEL
ncbi:MAG: hypothetical protein J5J06_10110 [Phycisphaerae bacterium]|nr:hypothetical protein [Phycisphaerae bacterium]